MAAFKAYTLNHYAKVDILFVGAWWLPALLGKCKMKLMTAYAKHNNKGEQSWLQHLTAYGATVKEEGNCTYSRVSGES